MPELPEVETARHALESCLAGRIIRSASKSRKRLRRPWPKKLSPRLAGRRVISLARRGKYILAQIDSKESLLIHLGMSGRFSLDPKGVHARHVHLRLALDDGASLCYCDPRRFGFIDLLTPDELAADPALARLGLDPFSAQLTPAKLKQVWRQNCRAIKPLLLEQSPIAGIGNIYACEALFAAGLSPFASACDLTQADYARLLTALRRILRAAIKAGGATLRDHQSPTGLSGRFQFQFKIYGRAGEPCYQCASLILARSQNGRTSFFCPACQPTG